MLREFFRIAHPAFTREPMRLFSHLLNLLLVAPLFTCKNLENPSFFHFWINYMCGAEFPAKSVR